MVDCFVDFNPKCLQVLFINFFKALYMNFKPELVVNVYTTLSNFITLEMHKKDYFALLGRF